MSLETETTIMMALIPFLAVWGLLRVAQAVERRRERCVSRQIALTDAIHRELGAAAAPEVRRTWTGEWVVSMRLALSRESTVGTSPASPAICSAGSTTGTRRGFASSCCPWTSGCGACSPTRPVRPDA